jgi:hypothetical protein
MMGVLLVLVRCDGVQLILDNTRVLAFREPRAVRDAKDVRVHRDGRLAKHHVQDDVRRLAANARQRFERRAVMWNLAAMLFDDPPAQLDQILRLLVVHPDGLDVRLHAFDAHCQDCLRGVRNRKENARRRVDALVGRMRRQHHGDEQLERRLVFELRGRARIRLLQAAIQCSDAGWMHDGSLSAAGRAPY